MKPGSHTLSWAALAALAVAIQFLPTCNEAFEYNRAATASGQLWRPITCHWTHWSRDHFFWSGGAFAALALICHRLAPRRGLACVALSAITVGAAVTVCTDYTHYRGLSGIDSALFAMIAAIGLFEHRAARRPSHVAAYAVLLLALAAKLAYECVVGAALFVAADNSGMSPVPLAHAAGAATGLLVGLAHAIIPKDHPVALIYTRSPPTSSGN